MRWAWHVARMGWRGEVHTGFWWGNLRERDHLEDLCRWQDVKISLREVGWGEWTGLIWLRTGTGGGHL